jgi:hypothetical protein
MALHQPAGHTAHVAGGKALLTFASSGSMPLLLLKKIAT